VNPALPARLAALVALAGGAAVGALAEHRLVRRPLRAAATTAPASLLEVTPAHTVTTADGVRLAVREYGPEQADLTVVFVHGYTVTAECWAAQVTALRPLTATGVRLVLYDQRGHGASTVGPTDHDTIEQLGSDLADVLRHRVPTGRILLAGHSMGGMTIMALAEQEPELFGQRIVGAALLGTSCGGMGEVTLGLPAMLGALPRPALPLRGRAAPINRRAERLRAADSDLGRWINAHVAFGPDVTGDELAADLAAMAKMQAPMRLETMTAFLPTFADHDREAALAPLKAIPAVIVVGERDVLTPVAHSQVIAAALPDAQLTVMPGSGHMVMMEAPDRVNALLRELIDRING
jgi:pimeloyl-ACP methyl ester carboxylesterase